MVDERRWTGPASDILAIARSSVGLVAVPSAHIPAGFTSFELIIRPGASEALELRALGGKPARVFRRSIKTVCDPAGD